jgi:hypothetical protein
MRVVVGVILCMVSILLLAVGEVWWQAAGDRLLPGVALFGGIALYLAGIATIVVGVPQENR